MRKLSVILIATGVFMGNIVQAQPDEEFILLSHKAVDPETELSTLIPAGSTADISFISGAVMGESEEYKVNPLPVMMRLTSNFTYRSLSGELKTVSSKNCTALGYTYPDIKANRINVRVQTFHCVTNDGSRHSARVINGVVVDKDGLLGLANQSEKNGNKYMFSDQTKAMLVILTGTQ
jgi:hypothetical protein